MSGGEADGAGLLEANPISIAVVIAFFLVVTLGFERLLHAARHALLRRKKLGLLAALNNFASEIMLLGLASLLLMAVESHVTSACYRANPNAPLRPWLANVNGCACCLQRTKGVSECFFQSKACAPVAEREAVCGTQGAFKGLHHQSQYAQAANSSAALMNSSTIHGRSRAHPLHTTTPSAAAVAPTAQLHGRRRRQLMVAEGAAAHMAPPPPVCNGPYLAAYEECDNVPGMVPLVTVETLHQVHMLLFVMAATHIIISGLVLTIAACKLKFYAWRGGARSSDAHGEDALAAAALAAAADEAAEQRGPTAATDALQHPKQQQQRGGIIGAAAAGRGGSAGSSSGSDSSDPGSAFAVVGPPGTAAAAAAAAGAAAGKAPSPSSPQAAAAGGVGTSDMLAAQPWHGRPARLAGGLVIVRELLVYLVRQVALLNTVSRGEYAVLRATFYRAHAPRLAGQQQQQPGKHAADGGSSDGGDHHHAPAAAAPASAPLHPTQAAGCFAPYVLEAMERDGSQVVGLGLPMWLLVLLFVVLSGFTGWASWYFLIAAAALLLGVNSLLLASLRHVTRGGLVRRHHTSRFTVIHRSSFLLGCIKVCLFFFTFVVSNSIYMAGFFGPESCFFSRTGFQGAPVPWWALLLVDVCLLFNLALFTLPIYSLTTHTLRVDASLLRSVAHDQAAAAAAAHAADKQKGGGASLQPKGSGLRRFWHASQPKSTWEQVQMAQSV